MLSTHLICGGLLGLGAALSSLVLGFPDWAVILLCALAWGLGALASAIGMHLFPPEQFGGPGAASDAVLAQVERAPGINVAELGAAEPSA